NYGVEHKEAMVSKVNYQENKGIIRDIELDDGEVVTADLFIDCTGLESQLINPLAEKDYENWRQFFPVDKEIAAFVDQASFDPYTRVNPVSQGWLQTIPLQHQKYIRYCFNADQCS